MTHRLAEPGQPSNAVGLNPMVASAGLNLPAGDRARRRILRRHMLAGGAITPRGVEWELARRLEEFLASPYTKRAKEKAARNRNRQHQRRARRITRRHAR